MLLIIIYKDFEAFNCFLLIIKAFVINTHYLKKELISLDRAVFYRTFALAIAVICAAGYFHYKNTSHHDSKEDAYIYIMSDVTSYIVNMEFYFEATGKNEELDLDKLLKVGSHQARDPFNLRVITFESYDIINSAGKYVNKKPKYEGLDENMKSLMKEFKKSLKLTEDMVQYYLNKEYEKDNFEKARKFHREQIKQIEALREIRDKTYPKFDEYFPNEVKIKDKK